MLKSILIVRLGAMGDIIHSLPGAASLKHSFPAARVTWVVEPQWVPLLEGNGFVDRIVPFRRARSADPGDAPKTSFAPSITISRSIFRGCPNRR